MTTNELLDSFVIQNFLFGQNTVAHTPIFSMREVLSIEEEHYLRPPL